MSDAKAKITAVLQKYLDCSFNKDLEGLATCFHEKAVMNGYIGDFQILATPQAYIDDLAGKPALKDENASKVPFNGEITVFGIKDKAASAMVVETGFNGLTFTDYMHLLEIDGEWKIFSKNFMGTPE